MNYVKLNSIYPNFMKNMNIVMERVMESEFHITLSLPVIEFKKKTIS